MKNYHNYHLKPSSNFKTESDKFLFIQARKPWSSHEIFDVEKVVDSDLMSYQKPTLFDALIFETSLNAEAKIFQNHIDQLGVNFGLENLREYMLGQLQCSGFSDSQKFAYVSKTNLAEIISFMLIQNQRAILINLVNFPEILHDDIENVRYLQKIQNTLAEKKVIDMKIFNIDSSKNSHYKEPLRFYNRLNNHMNLDSLNQHCSVYTRRIIGNIRPMTRKNPQNIKLETFHEIQTSAHLNNPNFQSILSEGGLQLRNYVEKAKNIFSTMEINGFRTLIFSLLIGSDFQVIVPEFQSDYLFLTFDKSNQQNGQAYKIVLKYEETDEKSIDLLQDEMKTFYQNFVKRNGLDENNDLYFQLIRKDKLFIECLNTKV